ncbi:Ferrochelatase [Rubripirellula tenax]|uniref:Ferrochelatase n=1 Tax=Rubripirellula tenax TaxID=2528015 RepID=A0A5C6EJ93_9BACT|nr:ferrochelatase [Rubripirellula tenax]TWU47329.1 Ferrochelatase [Rubripirellula tenax]
MTNNEMPYDSFLLVSFGGPEGQDDVMPFLENVLRGKNVPRERMLEVAEHYKHFGGVSPINQHNRELMAAIKAEFASANIDLPVYWANRNWDPLFPDTLRQMRDDGCKRALAFFTSMFSCYSGCRQYRENIIAAQEEVGEDAPIVEKVRMGFNHPRFIETMADAVRQAAASIDVKPDDTLVMFTAHSIPMGMADNCDYLKQLQESSRLVADAVGAANWRLVFQSRSGPPQQPWLEPDVLDAIAETDDASKLSSLVIVPIGFVSDHMEVMFDLDEEAAQLCEQRGIAMARAKTAGTSPTFVQMIRMLVEERLGRTDDKQAIGPLGPWHDVCPADCCTYTPARRPTPAS